MKKKDFKQWIKEFPRIKNRVGAISRKNTEQRPIIMTITRQMKITLLEADNEDRKRGEISQSKQQVQQC